MKTWLVAPLICTASSEPAEFRAADLLLDAIKLRIEPFGSNSLRIRGRSDSKDFEDSLPGALLPRETAAVLSRGKAGDVVRNGNIQASADNSGLVTVTRVSDQKVLLQEVVRRTEQSEAALQNPVSTVAFASTTDERIYGFGEHEQHALDNKGHMHIMEECLEYGHSQGGEVCLPFIFGTGQRSVEYGFLWNMPNYGAVDFADSMTNWTAYQAPQTDYFVTTCGESSDGAQRAADIMSSYVDAVGHAPMLPDYAAGYWHSRNRYATQSELLEAAEGFHNRSIPVDIIVIDYHHWEHMGDWSFNKTAWPDVDGMVQRVSDMGMRIMVSAWPFSATNSASFDDVLKMDLAVKNSTDHLPMYWNDTICQGDCYLLDESNKATRDYFWSRLKEGYFQHNMSIFWLDAAEPEIFGSSHDQALIAEYSAGTAQAAGMMFPYWHTQAIHDGLMSEGKKDGDIIMLARSAWAGSQRFGAVLWSGDTQSTWDTMKVSLNAGLNTQMSGIAWWTTDIGGYANGDPADPAFRELVTRWFQYGATCPIFRQHGWRETEIWKYGDAAYAAITKVINWRKSMKSYVLEQMRVVSETGTPVNRPLWWDFPEDEEAWNQTKSFMFGPKFLVSPITDPNVTTWTTYLPAGAKWQYYFDHSKVWTGGQEVTVPTPLDEFPLFQRLTTDVVVV